MRSYQSCNPDPTSTLRFRPVGLLAHSGLVWLVLAALAPNSWSETVAAFPPPSASMYRTL